jgi:hypothetical protein
MESPQNPTEIRKRMKHRDALLFALARENEFAWMQARIQTLRKYLLGRLELVYGTEPKTLSELKGELEKLKDLKTMMLFAEQRAGIFNFTLQMLIDDSLKLFCKDNKIELI